MIVPVVIRLERRAVHITTLLLQNDELAAGENHIMERVVSHVPNIPSAVGTTVPAGAIPSSLRRPLEIKNTISFLEVNVSRLKKGGSDAGFLQQGGLFQIGEV
jgi:hypothetical protein